MSIKQFLKRKLIAIKYKNSKIDERARVNLTADITKSTIRKYAGVAKLATLKNVTLEDYSSIGKFSNVVYTDIGKFCAISWNVTINAISHPYKNLTINAFPYVPYVGHFTKERKQGHLINIIKNDVWIGANSVIMPGITIGNGAIIGAGSVVTKDVSDYAIVVGIPAKIIKWRFSKNIIMQWWNLQQSIIKENIDLWQQELNKDILKNGKNKVS